MKKLLLLFLLCSSFFACRQNVGNGALPEDNPSLSLLTEDQPEWQYQNLRLYPILADEEFIRKNAAASELMTLAEAIDSYGFRISEKKPYGRFEDAGAVNNLTVQNKTSSSVLLLGGDIVQGGRQDRVVEADQIIAARSLQDIPVFCVEQHRWTYREEAVENEEAKAQHDKVFAFSGYYHVAAGDIRQTLAGSKSQQEVWDKVSRFRDHYAIDNETGAYAALEGSDNFTRERDAYLQFFDGKFADLKNMVGVMAVSGNRIIGTDIFGHPDLFQRALGPLLHSYVTDAVTVGQTAALGVDQLNRELENAVQTSTTATTTRYKGAFAHRFVEGPQHQ